jgi:hypothetical protein
MSVGKKDDSGKLPMGLIPPECEDFLAGVLQFGAIVYEPNNWQGVEEGRYYDAFRRHLNARRGGEFSDADSGLPHSAHAACNAIFLLWNDLQAMTKEDRKVVLAKIPEMAAAYKTKKEVQK